MLLSHRVSCEQCALKLGIFAPYRAEYQNGVEFGCLWDLTI